MLRRVINPILFLPLALSINSVNVLSSEKNNIDIVFNPEFLTEANAINDFKNQNRIIIGGPRPATTKVKRVFAKAFPKVPIIKTGSTTAEMVKYFTNTFLATKVSFANEMKMLCDKLNNLVFESSENGMRGIVGYNNLPLVSVDFNHSSFSSVYDESLTRSSQDKLYKICAWYDNEWGFSNRMLDVTKHWIK